MRQIMKDVLNKVKGGDIGAYAGQAALFLIMSLIPFLLVLISLIRFTPITESLILTGIELISPDYSSYAVITIVDEVYHNTGGILLISLVFAIYSAAKTIQSLRYALNKVYEIEENRNWFLLRVRAMFETLVLILAILLLIVLLMFGKSIQNVFEIYVPLAAAVTAKILKMRLLILFLVLTALFLVIYTVIPNRKARLRTQMAGSVSCAAAWYVFSFGVSIYINYFNGFSFYGSLTSLVLIMFWLYFAMYIFLVCGAVNASLETNVPEGRFLIGNKSKKSKGV